MSEPAVIAVSEPGVPESGVPIRGHGRRQDLASRIRPIIEAFVARLPAVRAAYLRADGTDFIFAGDDVSVEMSGCCRALRGTAARVRGDVRRVDRGRLPAVPGGRNPELRDHLPALMTHAE